MQSNISLAKKSFIGQLTLFLLISLIFFSGCIETKSKGMSELEWKYNQLDEDIKLKNEQITNLDKKIEQLTQQVNTLKGKHNFCEENRTAVLDKYYATILAEKLCQEQRAKMGCSCELMASLEKEIENLTAVIMKKDTDIANLCNCTYVYTYRDCPGKARNVTQYYLNTKTSGSCLGKVINLLLKDYEDDYIIEQSKSCNVRQFQRDTEGYIKLKNIYENYTEENPRTTEQLLDFQRDIPCAERVEELYNKLNMDAQLCYQIKDMLLFDTNRQQFYLRDVMKQVETIYSVLDDDGVGNPN